MGVNSSQTKKYINSRIIKFEKCCIDVESFGTLGNSQIIVPHKTISYVENKKNEEEASKVKPMHNLKFFPSTINHCIEWSRNLFDDYFVLTVNDIKNYFTDFEVFKETIKKDGNATQILEKLLDEKLIIDIILKKDLDKLIEYAIKKYIDNFDFGIQKLLLNFPPDFKNKKLPHNIPYNPNDELTFLFVKKFVYILSHALGFKVTEEKISKEYIKVSAKITIPEFKKKTIIENNLEKDEKKCEEIFEELKNLDKSKINPKKINPEEFEKDYDYKGHIDFIHAASNLRARNYEIIECDRNTTKIIVGKIIPPIMASKAAVAGQASMQLYTLLQTNEIKYLKNLFFNLSNNYYLFSEPTPPIKMEDKTDKEEGGPLKYIPNGWSIWDKLEIKGPKTCQQFFEEMSKKYGIDINFLLANGKLIISTKDDDKIFNEKKNTLIEEIYLSVTDVKPKENANYLWIKLSANIKKVIIKNQEFQDVAVEMPQIKYIYK